MKPHLLTIGIWLTVMWGLPPPWWPTAPADLVAQTAAPAPDRPAYRFEEIADGVYFASGTGAMTVMSNYSDTMTIHKRGRCTFSVAATPADRVHGRFPPGSARWRCSCTFSVAATPRATP